MHKRRGLKSYKPLLKNIFMNLPPLLQYLDEIISGRGTACGWGMNFCGVLANGDVTVCGAASGEPATVAGNILHEIHVRCHNMCARFV
jgi:hypothetical protein